MSDYKLQTSYCVGRMLKIRHPKKGASDVEYSTFDGRLIECRIFDIRRRPISDRKSNLFVHLLSRHSICGNLWYNFSDRYAIRKTWKLIQTQVNGFSFLELVTTYTKKHICQWNCRLTPNRFWTEFYS